MPGAARKDDTTLGSYTSNHCTHLDEDGNPIHAGGVVNGVINSGSSNVFINGQPAVVEGDIVNERDTCDNGIGTVNIGSSTVFINGKSAARKDDVIISHADQPAIINTGSDNVFIG